VVLPWDVRTEFGKGRIKSIRETLCKGEGDQVHIIVKERV